MVRGSGACRKREIADIQVFVEISSYLVSLRWPSRLLRDFHMNWNGVSPDAQRLRSWHGERLSSWFAKTMQHTAMIQNSRSSQYEGSLPDWRWRDKIMNASAFRRPFRHLLFIADFGLSIGQFGLSFFGLFCSLLLFPPPAVGVEHLHHVRRKGATHKSVPFGEERHDNKSKKPWETKAKSFIQNVE